MARAPGRRSPTRRSSTTAAPTSRRTRSTDRCRRSTRRRRRACHVNNRPGCTRLTINSQLRQRAPAAPLQLPGRHRHAAPDRCDTMSVQADYVYQANRHEWYSRNTNLNYNPATGTNYPVHLSSRSPRSRSGASSTSGCRRAQSHSHALDTAFTKRFSNGWQASATYTLAGKWDQDGPAFSGDQMVDVPARTRTSAGPRRRWPLAISATARRSTASGSSRISFQLSGLYFFGSGERFATSLRRRPAPDRRRCRRTGCVRTARSCRATISWASRSIVST